MRRLTSGFAKYFFFPVLRALAVYGQMYMPLVPYHPGGPLALTEGLHPVPEDRPAAPRTAFSPLDRRPIGPPPGHPERLRPDQRLSPYEREILRQLDIPTRAD